MKIVIDTNLLIDGASDDFNYGNRIIDAVIDGRLTAFANRSTLRENKLLVGQKITDPEYLSKLELYFGAVQDVAYLNERLDVVSDREDNKLVESAVAADAEYLITSDQHLLTLEEYQGIKIVRPAQFWTIFQEETSAGWGNWINQFINKD